MPADELRRRVKAARALAGFGSTKELAQAIGTDAKLGDRKLRTLEGDSAPRPFREPELEQIAKACGLPLAFFEIDFAMLDGYDRTLADRIAAIEEFIWAEVVPTAGEQGQPQQDERSAEPAPPRAGSTRLPSSRRRQAPGSSSNGL